MSMVLRSSTPEGLFIKAHSRMRPGDTEGEVWTWIESRPDSRNERPLSEFLDDAAKVLDCDAIPLAAKLRFQAELASYARVSGYNAGAERLERSDFLSTAGVQMESATIPFWGGVLSPADFIFAVHYVIENTDLDHADPRLAFLLKYGRQL